MPAAPSAAAVEVPESVGLLSGPLSPGRGGVFTSWGSGVHAEEESAVGPDDVGSRRWSPRLTGATAAAAAAAAVLALAGTAAWTAATAARGARTSGPSPAVVEVPSATSSFMAEYAAAAQQPPAATYSGAGAAYSAAYGGPGAVASAAPATAPAAATVAAAGVGAYSSAAAPAAAAAAGAVFQCTGSAAALQVGSGDGTSWRCVGGACIQASARCDGTPQCMDASDEDACGASGPAAAAATAAAPASGYAAPMPAAAAPMPAATAPAAPAPAAAGGYGGAAGASAAASSGGCTEKGGHTYSLDWKAQGSTFWDEWNYLQFEPNSGGAEYLTREEAMAKKVTEAHGTHAILRAGPKGKQRLKRASAKVETQRKWTYFLMAMKYEAVPWGCGVWPALWTHSPDAAWPQGGELDMLEYANEITSRTSFHTDAVANRCHLDQTLLNKPGCAHMPDAEFNFTGNYDCATHYPDKIGCAPNDMAHMANGQDMATTPSVVAAEWTPEYLKIWRIPNSELPADLASDAPQPDGWDRWLMSYYPFAESERNVPGSCPNPANVMKAQKLVMNLNFCGDWAAKVWVNSTCANKGQYSSGPFSAKGPLMGSQCVAVDPHNPKGETPAGPRDCCTQFIYDEDGSFGTDDYLAQHGFFNISWVKVYQSQGLRRLQAKDGNLV